MSAGFAAGQDTPDEGTARVERWFAALESPQRAIRLEARRRLQRLSNDERVTLDRLARDTSSLSYEAERAVRYALEHPVRAPRPRTVLAGTYQLGSDDPVDANPRREVELAEFTLDDVEVSNFEYAQFLAATGSSPPPTWFSGRYRYGQDDLPVADVSCREARAFAAWVGGRIPSSDEWEVAATSGDGRPYPWGTELPPRLRNVEGRLLPSGSEPVDRSPFGCFDMAGSLSEWTLDARGSPRARGGNVASRESWLRVVRAGLPKDERDRGTTLGIRVADRAQR